MAQSNILISQRQFEELLKRFSNKNQTENISTEFREQSFQPTSVQSDKSYQAQDSKNADRSMASHNDKQRTKEVEKNSKDIVRESDQNNKKLSHLSHNTKTEIIKQKQGHTDNDSPKSRKQNTQKYRKKQQDKDKKTKGREKLTQIKRQRKTISKDDILQKLTVPGTLNKKTQKNRLTWLKLV